MSYCSLSQTAIDDLLDVLIDGEDRAYPWDLATSPPDFSLFEDGEEGEIDERAGAFFHHLQERWEAIAAPRASLFDRFAALLPADSLNCLLEQAETVAYQPLDALDRLVACIRPLFPRWSVEDLQVFARPYALAMRDTTANPLPESKDWETRSDIEKIRLGAAIASQILLELSSNP
jgi:hypothetical protein